MYTPGLGDGQLRKYARPSFLGAEWRSNRNGKYFPCCHFLYFLSLILRKCAREVEGEVQHDSRPWQEEPPHPAFPCYSCRSQMLIVCVWGGGLTCPLGKMKCKFCDMGSFAPVWSCLIGPDWGLIWLAYFHPHVDHRGNIPGTFVSALCR